LVFAKALAKKMKNQKRLNQGKHFEKKVEISNFKILSSTTVIL